MSDYIWLTEVAFVKSIEIKIEQFARGVDVDGLTDGEQIVH